MGKFPKQPELKRTIKKWEKFLTGKHEMIGVMLRYTLSRHQSPLKNITDDRVVIKKFCNQHRNEKWYYAFHTSLFSLMEFVYRIILVRERHRRVVGGSAEALGSVITND